VPKYLTVTKSKIKSYSSYSTKYFNIWITFLRYHIQELQTFKNGPVFMAHPVCLTDSIGLISTGYGICGKNLKSIN